MPYGIYTRCFNQLSIFLSMYSSVCVCMVMLCHMHALLHRIMSMSQHMLSRLAAQALS